MSKKAAEVVGAAPKFKQPWQGFLSFFSIFIMAYITYQWLLHPVWGLLTKMIQANVFVAFWMGTAFGGPLGMELGLILSINNAMTMALYPLGYLVDWIPYFVFCIVWIVSLVVLARPFTPQKQPWFGIYMLALSMILAFVTWYILGIKLQWTGYDMILLGTCGFLIFPIWATMYTYWPFTGKRMGVHPAFRGAVFITISWILTFFVRWIIIATIWKNSIGNYYTMYLGGNLTQPLFVFYPYDYLISLVLSIIVIFTVISVLNLFPNMSQPKRGTLNLIIGVIIGIIFWAIVAAIVGRSSTTLLMPDTGAGPWLLTTPYSNYGAVAAYVAFPLVTLLAGQLSFGMWPWSRWGKWGNLIWVIVAFIIGSILYYIIMINPGYASAITGANLITSMSGIQSLYLFFLEAGAYQEFLVFALYFEGLIKFVGSAIMFAWTLTVLIFYLLAYEGLDHWPWK